MLKLTKAIITILDLYHEKYLDDSYLEKFDSTAKDALKNMELKY